MNQDKSPKMESESDLERAAVDFAGLYGIVSYKWVSPGSAGVPDRIFILPGGETIYVEFKHPDGSGRLSKLQERRIEEIRRNGASAYECENYDEFKRIIERHLEKAGASERI